MSGDELRTSPTAAAPSERTAWRARFRAVRAATLDLTRGLTPEDQQIQSMPDASPTKWHLAHASWFFETFLLAGLSDYRVFDPRFGFLFNSYYEAVGERLARPARGLMSRPSLADIEAYRDHVEAAVDLLIADCPAEQWRQVAGVLELGLHHEQQHQELILMDIKHALSLNPLSPAYAPGRDEPAGGGGEGWTFVPGGLCEIGDPGGAFAFDNEGPRHRVWIEPFRLRDGLVTAGEWLAFIEDGGYRRPELWLSDGWRVAAAERWSAPLYWRSDRSGARRVFTLQGERPLNPAEPVCHVSFYEADAYARWRGARLPTEAEWETAAVGHAAAPGKSAGRRLHPAPTTGPAGLRQMFGEVWQWTASPYVAFPGYRPPTGALGEYNGKFMSNQMVLRGGACVTPPGHARATYRNFFPPAARWHFGGVRLADHA